MTIANKQFLIEQLAVDTDSEEVWYPKQVFTMATIRILPGVGATASVQFSTDLPATILAGTETWTAASTDLTSKTAASYDTLLGPVTALKFISADAASTFQIVQREV